MKKILINLILAIVSIIVYYLESNFFSWFNIAGVKPNLFVILVLFIGLFANQSTGTIYGILIGTIVDLLIGSKVGINAASLGLIGFLSGIIDKNFSKDTKMTVIFMVIGSTAIFETVICVLQYIFVGNVVSLFSFTKVLIIEIIFNILITIILYPLMQVTGYYIENEYKGNKILTRYF